MNKIFEQQKIDRIRFITDKIQALLADNNVPECDSKELSALYAMEKEDLQALQKKCAHLINLYDKYYFKAFWQEKQREDYLKEVIISSQKKMIDIGAEHIIYDSSGVYQTTMSEIKNTYDLKHPSSLELLTYWRDYSRSLAEQVRETLKPVNGVRTFEDFVVHLNTLYAEIEKNAQTIDETPKILKPLIALFKKAQSALVSALTRLYNRFFHKSAPMPEDLKTELDELIEVENLCKKTSPCLSFATHVQRLYEIDKKENNKLEFPEYQKTILEFYPQEKLNLLSEEIVSYASCCFTHFNFRQENEGTDDVTAYPQVSSRIQPYQNYLDNTETGYICYDMMADRIGPKKGWLYGYYQSSFDKNAAYYSDILNKTNKKYASPFQKSFHQAAWYLKQLSGDIIAEQKKRVKR